MHGFRGTYEYVRTRYRTSTYSTRTSLKLPLLVLRTGTKFPVYTTSLVLVLYKSSTYCAGTGKLQIRVRFAVLVLVPVQYIQVETFSRDKHWYCNQNTTGHLID